MREMMAGVLLTSKKKERFLISWLSRENQTLGVDRNATLVACSSISFVSIAMVLEAYQYWLSSHFSSVLAKNLFLTGVVFVGGDVVASGSFMTGAIENGEL